MCKIRLKGKHNYGIKYVLNIFEDTYDFFFKYHDALLILIQHHHFGISCQDFCEFQDRVFFFRIEWSVDEVGPDEETKKKLTGQRN